MYAEVAQYLNTTHRVEPNEIDGIMDLETDFNRKGFEVVSSSDSHSQLSDQRSRDSAHVWARLMSQSSDARIQPSPY